jgi:hypothetical protein
MPLKCQPIPKRLHDATPKEDRHLEAKRCQTTVYVNVAFCIIATLIILGKAVPHTPMEAQEGRGL